MDGDQVLRRWQAVEGRMLKSALAGIFLLVLGVMAYLANSARVARDRGDEAVPSATDSRTRGEASASLGSGPRPETGDPGDTTDQHAQPAEESVSPNAKDTISPNPPNGMTFGGSGHFQLYRQGDLTWRLNTSTGETCIVFATTEEWKQPRVRRAACPKVSRP